MDITRAVQNFRRNGLKGFDTLKLKGDVSNQASGENAFKSLADTIDIELPTLDRDRSKDLDPAPNKITYAKSEYGDKKAEFEGDSKKGSMAFEGELPGGTTTHRAWRFNDGLVEGLTLHSREGDVENAEVTRFSADGAYQYKTLDANELGWLSADGAKQKPKSDSFRSFLGGVFGS